MYRKQIFSIKVLIAILTFLSFISFNPYNAEAVEKEFLCTENVSRIKCEIRADAPLLIDKVDVSYSGKDFKGTNFSKFSDLKNQNNITFLLDLNNKLDPAHFTRYKKLILNILNANIQNVNFEVIGISNINTIIAPLGTARETIKLALNGSSQSGKSTEILKSTSQFVDQVKDRSENRKIIVFLSSGISDDKAYTAQEISIKLKQEGFLVYSLVPFRDKPDNQATQILQRLADETQGKLITNLNDKETELNSIKIGALLSNGGIISFDKVSQDFDIKINYTGGSSDLFKYKSNNNQNIVEPSSDKLPDNNNTPKENSNFIEKNIQLFIDWFNLNDTNKFISISFGVLFFFIILIGSRKMLNKQNQIENADNVVNVEITEIKNEIKPILAWFEVLDGKNSQETISSPSATIGRQKDNDIVFFNTSVHRHHAILTQDPNGHFLITDLGGENGTIINGVKSKSSIISDGDIIELGEVRMRFRVPNGK